MGKINAFEAQGEVSKNMMHSAQKYSVSVTKRSYQRCLRINGKGVSTVMERESTPEFGKKVLSFILQLNNFLSEGYIC